MGHLSFILVSACLACAGLGRRVKFSGEQSPAELFEGKDGSRTHNAFATLLLALNSAPAFNTPLAGGLLSLHNPSLGPLQPSSALPPTLHSAAPRRRALTPRSESNELVDNLKYQLSNADPEIAPPSDLLKDPAAVLVVALSALIFGLFGYLILVVDKQKDEQSVMDAMFDQRAVIRSLEEQGRYQEARAIQIDMMEQERIAAAKKKEEETSIIDKVIKKEEPDLRDEEEKLNRFERRLRRKTKKGQRRSGDPMMSTSDPPRSGKPLAAVSGLLSAFSGSSTFSVGPDTNVEPLGFGTWQWGNKLLWGYDPEGDDELQRAFDVVATPGNPFDSRRFFFDTGDSYGTGKLEGRGEELLGRFRRESPSPERAVCGTKLAVYPWRLTGASFEDACRKSLERMGRDQIELAQAHWSARNLQPWQEPALWDGLARCHEAGLCRAVGTSNFGPEQLGKVNEYWRNRGVPHTVNQMQLSLLSTLPIDSGCMDACRELGVTPIGYSPLALGVLSGKYSEERLPEGPRGLIFKALLPSLKPLLGTIGAIAEERNVPFTAVPINWSMCKGALVIVGMKTPEQVRENLQACGWRLNDDEIEELERAAKKAKKATQNIFQTA